MNRAARALVAETAWRRGGGRWTRPGGGRRRGYTDLNYQLAFLAALSHFGYVTQKRNLQALTWHVLDPTGVWVKAVLAERLSATDEAAQDERGCVLRTLSRTDRCDSSIVVAWFAFGKVRKKVDRNLPFV